MCALKTEPVAVSANAYAGINNKASGKIQYEFGGPIGAGFLIIWSHWILLYFWYCLETANGHFLPKMADWSTANLQYAYGEKHAEAFWELLNTKGVPSSTTWIVYMIFFFVQILLAAVMPGITMYGLPTAPHGKKLPYHCNGYLCYYATLAIFVWAHYMDYFRMSYLADNYGEVLICSMIIGDVTSLFWYFYGLIFADEYNGRSQVTGNWVYDFFMGTILYPRIGEIDIKMIAEARWSWTTLLLLTMSAAAQQYNEKGYISPNLCIMLVAHWLYSNACAKGEHCIPCTWDMFHENYGWMLNFWNITGVPFLYCYQSLYIARNQDTIDQDGFPILWSVAVFSLLLVAYYIFDTANSQKATIKIRMKRNTFPQLPWAILDEPITFIETPKGKLLVDGWYAFGRKMQYTGDILMALSWGLATGFPYPFGSGSTLNYFYVIFFTCMILHRQSRDEIRCSEKYGEHWKLYTSRVPNVFIPSMAFFQWYFLGGPHPNDSYVKKIAVAAAAAASVPSVTFLDPEPEQEQEQKQEHDQELELELELELEEPVPAKKEAKRRVGRPSVSRSTTPTPLRRSRVSEPAPSKESTSRSSSRSRRSSTNGSLAPSTAGKKSRSTTPSREKEREKEKEKERAGRPRDRPVEILMSPRLRKPSARYE